MMKCIALDPYHKASKVEMKEDTVKEECPKKTQSDKHRRSLPCNPIFHEASYCAARC